MENNIEKRIEFLYAAISDAQELIRFIDTKTAVAITIMGSLILGLFTTLETILKYSKFYSCAFYLCLIALVILLILCIWMTSRIIKPTNNPKDNLDIDLTKTYKLKFFLPRNEYTFGFPFYNSSKHKLIENFSEYVNTVNNSTNIDIIETLTLELFKVSYIRNIKNDRFNKLLTVLVLTTLTFFIEYLMFLNQTNEIKSLIEHCCKR